MADAPVVHIGENSPEEVAYRLMRRIEAVEVSSGKPDRKWLLSTYAACLKVVQTAHYSG